MFSIFRPRQTSGEKAQQEQREQSLDRIVKSVEKQKNDLIEDIRSMRERRMLRETLGGGDDT